MWQPCQFVSLIDNCLTPHHTLTQTRSPLPIAKGRTDMRCITWLGLLGLGFVTVSLYAQEPGGGAAEFRKQRRTIEAKLVSPNLNDRVVGLGELKRYPLIDTV